MNKTKYLYLLIIFVPLFFGCSQDLNIQTEDEELFEMTTPAQRNIDRSAALLKLDEQLSNAQRINSLVNQFGMSEEQAKSALGIKE